PDFSLLGCKPEPWTGAAVLAWGKMMALDLSKTYPLERLRHDVLGAVGPHRLAELFPSYPDDGLSILAVSDMQWLKQGHPPGLEETAYGESRQTTPPVPGGWSAAVASALDGSLPAVR